ncbi:MAG: ADP-forming succinate--CoA ligase subunit beta [Phycisphaeraceae bacterium]|nr:ADP-forming succinate--CoA ligase subunit beta [Phycisphaeraceae bacterium]
MKIHEYQARELLASFGIPVPAGQMIDSVGQAGPAYDQAVAGMAKPLAVVKAQVHAGGRGKAGFVKLVNSRQQAIDAATFMLAHRMTSPQTPPEGLEVKKLLIAQAADIADRAPSGKQEFYLAITLDRKSRRNVLIASREGGVEIETIAHERPEAIIKQPLDPVQGLLPFQAREVAFALGLVGKQVNQAADIMLKLARCYIEKDCTIAEINPLVITPPDAHNPDGRVLALDAKFNFDDNGTFRHKDIQAMHDPTEENPAEIKAKEFNLSYVALDGNIGCLVNGAGLAMATMDIIKLQGGEPANFLDVGGGATEEAVTEAFSIILSDPRCQGVLVNIFGGIMKCDIIAQGIVNAAKGYKNPDGTTGFKVPLVVRLEGTNVDAGRKILEESKRIVPTLQAAKDLGDAARKVCAAVK